MQFKKKKAACGNHYKRLRTEKRGTIAGFVETHCTQSKSLTQFVFCMKLMMDI